MLECIEGLGVGFEATSSTWRLRGFRFSRVELGFGVCCGARVLYSGVYIYIPYIYIYIYIYTLTH